MKSYEALRVGYSTDIRRRVTSLMTRKRLLGLLKQSKTGERVIIYGVPLIKGGQDINKFLLLLNRALIQHFISQGHDLINLSGTKLRQHEIIVNGPIPKSFVPSSLYLGK